MRKLFSTLLSISFLCLSVNLLFAQEKTPIVKNIFDTVKANPKKGLWNFKKTDLHRINVVKMVGESKMHKHPDAEHTILLIKGSMIAEVDGKKIKMKGGHHYKYGCPLLGAGSTLKMADSTNLDKKFRTFIPEEELKAARPGRIATEAQIAAWKNTLAGLKRIHDSGVKMLDGTDALITGVFHGPSVHWVLSFFCDAGIPNIDVLKIGTIKAAESVGAATDLGSLEKGKLADLLLLDADPLKDINNTLKIWMVLKSGVVFDPETMREKGL